VLEARLGKALERAGADQRLPGVTDHLGVFRQRQAALNYVGLLVPVGRITGDQLIEVARLASRYGTGEIRLTPDQNVIVPNVPDATLGNLTVEPLLKVLRIDPSEIMRGLVSCTGIEFLENVPCDRLPQVLEGLVRHGDPEKVRRQLRAVHPAAPMPASAPKDGPAGSPRIRVEELAEGAGTMLLVHGVEIAVFRRQD